MAHLCALRDVGTVIDSVQNDKVADWYSRTRAVILAVQRQPNTNTIQIVDRILKSAAQNEAVIPAAIKLNILSMTVRNPFAPQFMMCSLPFLSHSPLVVLVIFLFVGQYFRHQPLPVSLCLYPY